MLWSDILASFHQFPVLQAGRYAASRFLTRLLDKHAAQSYSQFGEDRVLPLLLEGSGPGFYVDVGANEPVRWSNTFSLYKRGWRGLTIDANAALVQWHRRLRPRDTQVHAAVSNREAEFLFTEFANAELSSLSPAHVAAWQPHTSIRAQYVVKARTLGRILDEHRVPSDFSLLNVDVEGHDLQVLESLDWSRYHPKVIVVEMAGFNPAATADDPVYSFLLAQRYRLRAFDVMNGYFTLAS